MLNLPGEKRGPVVQVLYPEDVLLIDKGSLTL
jgi:hypothetical protein